MTNRVESGQSSRAQYTSVEEKAAAVLDDDDQITDTQGEASPSEDDSWDVGDAVGDFWDGVKGEAAQARETLEQTAESVAQKTTEDVGAALDAFDEAMHEIAEVPDEIIDGGETLFEAFQQQKTKLAEQMDDVFDRFPQEALVETAKDVFDGAWNLTEDVAKTLQEVDIGETVFEAGELTIDALDDVVDVGFTGIGLDDAVKAEVRKAVVTVACNAAVEHRELIEGAAEFLQENLESDALDTVSPLLLITPFAGVLESSRRSSLMLAHIAQDAPELAELLLDDEDAMEAVANPNGVERLSKKIAEVDVGEPPFVTQTEVEISAHKGLGGSVSLSSSCEVKKRDEDTYRVTIELSGSAKAGLGLESLGKGVKGDLEGGASGKLVIDVSGEEAEEHIARYIAGSRDQPEELLKLAGQIQAGGVDAELVEVSGIHGGGLSGEVGPLGASVGLDSAFKTIDGEAHVGMSGRFSMSAGVDTGYLQTPDGFAEAMEAASDSTNNPLVEQMIGALPSELVEGVEQVYGPTAGLRLVGEGRAELGIYTPASGDGPVRLEFDTQLTVQAGRSTFSAENKMIITDVEGFAKAVGTSKEALTQGLASGELTPQGIIELAAQSGEDIGQFVENKGPTVVMAGLKGFDLKAFGQRFMEGRQHTTKIYPPPRGSTVREQLEQLGTTYDEAHDSDSARLAAQVEAQRLGASLSSF